MESDLQKYKNLVDGIVSYQGSVHYILTAFQAGEWTNAHAAVLADLSDQQKQAVWGVMKAVSEAATHDVLASLSQQEVTFLSQGQSLPEAPFGTTLYEDWAARIQKLPWPDEE